MKILKSGGTGSVLLQKIKSCLRNSTQTRAQGQPRKARLFSWSLGESQNQAWKSLMELFPFLFTCFSCSLLFLPLSIAPSVFAKCGTLHLPTLRLFLGNSLPTRTGCRELPAAAASGLAFHSLAQLSVTSECGALTTHSSRSVRQMSNIRPVPALMPHCFQLINEPTHNKPTESPAQAKEASHGYLWQQRNFGEVRTSQQ